MAVRDVVYYPDARLTTVCEPLGHAVGESHVEQLARDLLDTMRSFPGCVGIAAPQIGALVRMVAIDATGHRKTRTCHGELVLIDPVVVASSGRVKMREGCLSIPDFTGDVRRPADVTISATTPEGSRIELATDAYEARILLHEIDHLDGMLFLDRVDAATDIYPRKTYQ